MPAHRNITGALPTGISFPTGTQMEDVGYTASVDLIELPAAASGEIISVGVANHEHRELSITGDGPVDLAGVAAGVVSTISNYAVTELQIAEALKSRCRFTLKATADLSFTDPGATPAAAGEEPVIGTLTIVSVEYSVAESVSRTARVGDHVLLGTDSAPAYKSKEGVMIETEIAGRGDTPSGFALGTGGAAFSGSDTGVVVMKRKTNGERRKDWNRWGGSINQYPSAT